MNTVKEITKTVLIVEDSRSMLKILKDILTQEKFNVIAEAEYGGDAIEKYKQYNPDLVSIDIVLSDMTGIEVLKKILEINKDAKAIICSSLGYDTLVEEALKIGAKAYVKKPFRPLEVILAANKALGI